MVIDNKEVSFQTAQQKTKLEQIQNELSEVEKKIKSDRRYIRFFGSFTLGLAVTLIVEYATDVNLNTWVEVAVWFFFVFFLLALAGTDVKSSENERDRLNSVKRIYLGLPDNLEQTYFDRLVKINIENLAAYYSLVKAHTDSSFKITSFAGIVGFLLVITGIVIGFIEERLSNVAIIATGAGVITEFITGVIFFQYTKTIEQLKGYHDSLLHVQNILLSFKLVEDTNSEDRKSEMVGELIKSLVSKSQKSQNANFES